MSLDDIKTRLALAEDAVKDINEELKQKAFEIVLKDLLQSSTKKKHEESGRAQPDSTIWSIIPHVLYVAATWSFGISLIVLVGPFFYGLLTSGPITSVVGLAEVSIQWWGILLSSMDTFLMAALAGLPIGFVLTEGLPRFIFGLKSGRVVIDKLKGGKNYDEGNHKNDRNHKKHFEFRYWLQGDSRASRVWEWEIFVYTLVERLQVTLFFVTISLVISYVYSLLVIKDYVSLTLEFVPIIIISLLFLLGSGIWSAYRWEVLGDAHTVIWDIFEKDKKRTDVELTQ